MYEAVVRAIEGVQDPWERLIAAAEAHCALLVESKGLVAVLVPSTLGPIRRQVVAQRDRYGALFENLVAALDLRDGVDRTVFRLQLLVGLTGMLSWYRKSGRFTPRQLAHQYVEMLAYGTAGVRQKRSHRGKAALAIA